MTAVIALIGALTALATAIAGVIALFRHASSPAHTTPATPPAVPKS